MLSYCTVSNMYLFSSQAKCAVLQKLRDYHHCNMTFPNGGNKPMQEIQGLIHNLQVMKSVIDGCRTFANSTHDELQCFFVFADAQVLR